MIVGAGAVGCYLGSKMGSMEIWEANKEITEKACTALFSRNIRKLDIDLSGCVLNQVKGAKFFSKNENFIVEKPETQAYVVDRLAFQKRLYQNAVDAGCTIKFGKRWRGEDYHDEIIGADGANSAVADDLAIKHKFMLAYQEDVEFEEKISSDFVELHFGDFAPGFFGWMVPTSDRTGRVGLACAHGNAAENYKTFSKKFKIKKTLKTQGGVIPVFDPLKKTVMGKYALVGDAAAQIKNTSGGGILMGCLCAEELRRALNNGDIQKYEKYWRGKYEKMLKDHDSLRKFLNRCNYDKLFRLIKDKEIDKLIEMHGDMEDTSALKKQVFRRPSLWLLGLRVMF
ncbi:MAG: NAD(P)/FAD-dependent oxidoreductase [Candidatus Micrarchaeota archaeon]